MNEVIRWLVNFAYDHKIGVTLDNLHFDQEVPSCMFGNSIIINMNWENQDELPFITAHEIGHVLNEDQGPLYYCSASAHNKIEAAANEKAIDLMLNYCVSMDNLISNYTDFMYYYGIPNCLNDKVKERYALYFNH